MARSKCSDLAIVAPPAGVEAVQGAFTKELDPPTKQWGRLRVPGTWPSEDLHAP